MENNDSQNQASNGPSSATPPKPEQQSAAPVMDIQPPRSHLSSSSQSRPSLNEGGQSVGVAPQAAAETNTSSPQTDSSVSGTHATPAETTDNEGAPTAQQSPLDQPNLTSLKEDAGSSKPDFETEKPNPLAIKHDPKTKTKGNASHIIAVIVAVLVTALLGVAAVFAYLHMNEANPTPSANQTESQQQNNVTADELDELNQNINESLQEIDNDSDFPEDELSDSNLGL